MGDDGCCQEGCHKKAKWGIQILSALAYRVPLCEEHAETELKEVGYDFEEPYAIKIED